MVSFFYFIHVILIFILKVCGAAPLDPKVRGFIREAMSVYFIEGYGQTENCAGISATMFANYCDEDGAVGTVIPCGAVRLMDVDDMNYKAKNNQGFLI